MLNIVTRQAFEAGQPIRVDGKVGKIVEVDDFALKVEFEIPDQLKDGVPITAFEWIDWVDVLQASITRN